MQSAHHRMRHLQHVDYAPCTKRIVQLRRWLLMHISDEMLFFVISNRITSQLALGSAEQWLAHGRQPEANQMAVASPVAAAMKTNGRCSISHRSGAMRCRAWKNLSRLTQIIDTERQTPCSTLKGSLDMPTVSKGGMSLPLRNRRLWCLVFGLCACATWCHR